MSSKSSFSDEQLKELHLIIKKDLANLFFTLFLKKKTWQSAMSESNESNTIINEFNIKLNSIIRQRIIEKNKRIKENAK